MFRSVNLEENQSSFYPVASSLYTKLYQTPNLMSKHEFDIDLIIFWKDIKQTLTSHFRFSYRYKSAHKIDFKTINDTA